MYWEYRVNICKLLKISLQESLGPILAIILIIFFSGSGTEYQLPSLPHDVIIGGPFYDLLLVKLLPDLITGIHNTAICQKNRIQSKRTCSKF